MTIDERINQALDRHWTSSVSGRIYFYLEITEVYNDFFKAMIQKMEKGFNHTVLNEMRRLVARNDMTLATHNDIVKRKEKEEII
tara:strand:- start:1397 stop:1648 length:252 start_codon:yes stop_codon:yes gene_type:complete